MIHTQPRFHDVRPSRIANAALPRLAERKEDLPLLHCHFVSRFAAEYKKGIRGLTHRAQIRLSRHSWPGNVRELENVIGHAAVMTGGYDLIRALEATAGNQSKAARLLQITRDALRYKVKNKNLHASDSGEAWAAYWMTPRVQPVTRLQASHELLSHLEPLGARPADAVSCPALPYPGGPQLRVQLRFEWRSRVP